MPLGTPFLDDLVAVHVNGVVSMTLPAQVAAKVTGTMKTATKTFSVPYNGHLVLFTKAVPVMCDAGLLAALAAGGYPVV